LYKLCKILTSKPAFEINTNLEDDFKVAEEQKVGAKGAQGYVKNKLEEIVHGLE
jgi:hypothetical protein